MNRKARPVRYQSPRDYVAANFASRTMRWTGVIVGLFVIFHLLDLTWGTANPNFVRGDPYDNLFDGFERVPVAIVYILANIALGVHLFHGVWSMFQSLGWNNPRFNVWRRYVRGRVRRADRRRQREHAPADHDRSGDEMSMVDVTRLAGSHRARSRRSGTTTSSTSSSSTRRTSGSSRSSWSAAGWPARRPRRRSASSATRSRSSPSTTRRGAAHSIAAQGGINAAKNYHNDGDSVFRLFYDTVKGGDYRAREANVYRLAQLSA